MTHGDTPVITAARADDAARVRALLEADPDPEALGADGLTALEIAATRGAYPVADALRSHGARLARHGPDGRTPLLPRRGDPSVEIRAEAVRALVLLDDPRGEEDWPGSWSLDEAHRHLRRRREAAAGAAG
ncbi:ankyrin repeat domain-containing protein [Streptomyces sp. NBC_00105]|uniref:ankyrin repeat domain-containing protein n=1 Tax=unclassified Streptomyces TaxID=2593676 RepID=UPI00324CA0D1